MKIPKEVKVFLIVFLIVFCLSALRFGIGMLIHGSQKILPEEEKIEKALTTDPDLLDGDFTKLEEYEKMDISNWKHYRDEEMGFEMKIPNLWECKEEPGFSNEKSSDESDWDFKRKSVRCEISKEEAKEATVYRMEDVPEQNFSINYYLSHWIAEQSTGEVLRKRASDETEKSDSTKNYLSEIDGEKQLFVLYKDSLGETKLSAELFSTKRKGKYNLRCREKTENICPMFIKSTIETFEFL